MSNYSVPPLPNAREHHNAAGGSGGAPGMLAACSGGAAIIALGASVFLLYQEEATMSVAGLVLSGLAMLAGLIALILGFVAVLAIKGGSRVPGVVGMVSGMIAIVAIIVVSVMGLFRAASQNFQMTVDGIEARLPPIAPLVINGEARDVDDNYQLWIQWFEQNLFEPMQVRLQGKPWQEDGKRVMDGYVSDWLGKWDMLTELEWQALAANLRRAKCDDPMLLYMISRSCDIGNPKSRVLTQASKDLAESDFNPVWAFMAQIDKIAKVDYYKKGEQRDPGNEEALKRLKRACEAGSFESDNLWLLHQLLRMGGGAKFAAGQGDKIAGVFEQAGMPEWTLHWMNGLRAIDAAWKSRGSGYSSKVTKAGWKGFSEYLAEARTELTQAWELAPDYPFAAASMITVSMGRSDNPLEEMRLWMDRSLHAQMDYRPALKAYEYGLYPKWHGSHEMMRQFGEFCLDSDRFKTALPWFYKEVIKDLASESSDSAEFYKQDWVYEGLTRMYEGQASACIDSAGRRANWTELAVRAYRVGDYNKLAQIWKNLKGMPMERVVAQRWQLDREDFAFCAVIDQADVRIQMAGDFRQQGLYQEAIDEYKIFVKQEDLNAESLASLRKRMALLEVEQKWESGEWVSLWPTDSPELWRAAEGRWEKTEEGALQASSETFRYAIEHTLFVGKNYEVEAIIGPSHEIPNSSGHGIWLSKRPWSGTRWDALVFGAMKKNQFYVGARRWRYRTEWYKKIERKEPHVMNLKCHRKYWMVSVDGKKMTDNDIDMGTRHNGGETRIALGGYVNVEANTTVEYQSVRVRRLQERKE